MSNLEDIKNRLAAATPGPWVMLSGRHPYQGDYMQIDPIVGLRSICDVTDQHEGNGNLIAHAPEDIARLVKALEAVQSVPRSGFGDPWASGYNTALNEIRRAITEALDS